MDKFSRRKFLGRIGGNGAAASLVLPLSFAASITPSPNAASLTIEVTLEGTWLFKLDPQGQGEASGWYRPQTAAGNWEPVTVPHTWQVNAKSADYMGTAWYRKDFDAPAFWAGKAVRLEFEAVFHSATVWLNGELIGEHLRKGYTAFTLDTGHALRLGGVNHLTVRADNSFDEHMLPRGKSYDWTPDGGIIRPVQLLITPQLFIERVDVDAQPDLDANRGDLDVRVALRNTSSEQVEVEIAYRIEEEESGLTVLRKENVAKASLNPASSEYVILPKSVLPEPRLWHFDHPHLYRLEAEIKQSKPVHRVSTTFGVRKFEVRDGGFFLNGERMRLMGVERMAGSNPDFGMAEPETWIRHDHHDLKGLNCVFTRVHWPQDKRVLDYCDRHGILFQEEVPAWGYRTFEGMGPEISPEILQNGREQLREMIHRDRNHPSIIAWGLCNEVNGQNPLAYNFARRLYEEAKKLDPHRLLTYASNSLYTTDTRWPEINKDVAGLMDFIEWNEYYESWHKGGVDVVKNNLEEIHRTFPEKPIVISEYGYCECTPERLGGDPKRIEILRTHNDAYREYDYVAGLIFFCYNDYRTHIGDEGVGVMKQRVHGVVDLYGNLKPSYEALRHESSPVADLRVTRDAVACRATLVTRNKVPAYVLDGYAVRWIVYGFGDLPMEKHEKSLPRLAPGQTAEVELTVDEPNPKRLIVDVLRPTGFSVLTAEWRPS